MTGRTPASGGSTPAGTPPGPSLTPGTDLWVAIVKAARRAAREGDAHQSHLTAAAVRQAHDLGGDGHDTGAVARAVDKMLEEGVSREQMCTRYVQAYRALGGTLSGDPAVDWPPPPPPPPPPAVLLADLCGKLAGATHLVHSARDDLGIESLDGASPEALHGALTELAAVQRGLTNITGRLRAAVKAGAKTAGVLWVPLAPGVDPMTEWAGAAGSVAEAERMMSEVNGLLDVARERLALVSSPLHGE